MAFLIYNIDNIDKEAEILYLEVHRNYRNFNIATQLLNIFINNYKKINNINIYALKSSFNFWLKKGFLPIYPNKLNQLNACEFNLCLSQNT